MFNFLSLINKNNNQKKIKISKNPLVIYFKQPLVKSENCTVKITFEPLKLYRQTFILYQLRLSVILRPLSFLLISSPDVSDFWFFRISHNTTTTITWIVSLKIYRLVVRIFSFKHKNCDTIQHCTYLWTPYLHLAHPGD